MKRVIVFLLISVFTFLFFSACSIIEIEPDSAKVSKSSAFDDPAMKKDIRGNLDIAFAWGQRLSPPRQYLRALINLKDAMHRWTEINTRLVEHLRLDSDKLMNMPFVYVTTERAFELTAQERSNVKKYLLSGGFMVLDNAIPQQERSQSEAALRKMMRDVLGSGARFEPIPRNHGIYHSYFDFDDGPPQGAEVGLLGSRMSKPVRYLEGIWLSNRLVAVFSNKGYVVKWNDMTNNEPQLKMGVNMVVFALTQPGGIAGLK